MNPPEKQHTETPSPGELFLDGLEKAFKFHQNNPKDPHGIANAVMCSLLETHNAFARAYGSIRRL